MGDFNIFHHMPWSSTYSIYFFIIGISAALFFMSALSWYRDGIQDRCGTARSIVSFVLLAVSGLLLIGDLSQPAALPQHPESGLPQLRLAAGLGRSEPDRVRHRCRWSISS